MRGELNELEFIVEGTPRSLQGSARGVNEWKDIVRKAAQAASGDAYDRIEMVDVSARIIHFCFDWTDTSGDLDNIAKPILDAIAGVAFFNDNQITQLFLRRTDLGRHGVTQVDGATPLLAERIDDALQRSYGLGFVYIVVSASVDHGRLL